MFVCGGSDVTGFVALVDAAGSGVGLGSNVVSVEFICFINIYIYIHITTWQYGGSLWQVM